MILRPAAALLLTVTVLAGCGDKSSDELSSSRASSLRSALDDVQERVAAKDCTGAAQQASEFLQRVEALPQRVDSDLRRALASSAKRLESLVTQQCKEPAPAAEPSVGTTSENQGQQDQQQDGKAKKEKAPKKEKPGTGVPPDQGTTGPETAPEDSGSGGATGPGG